MAHGSFMESKLTGNLLDRETLLAQENGLLIARISLRASDSNGPSHLSPWIWTPFFHGDGRLFLNVCCSCSGLSRRFHLGEDACEEPLDSL